MTMGDNTVDVIAISDQPATQNQITAALSAENEFNLLDVLSDQENLAWRSLRRNPGLS
jgi:TusA-related sulfurtransferase